ncbi:DUF4831 family protein [Carboxylicivirga sediminis]|uniref:DUF4831 family protein n=1 Tax=Carboxylicivirga sediminis TaxID=2006564 RepID=A0A941F6P1_9BACT|nr:DUF4831 family protein [Carboxylicivirga sediminis]MBR8537407.1 DUF4831 family protein [Carboxylicivirga sediminis]
MMKKLFLSIGIVAALTSCAVEQTIPSKVNVQDVATMTNATSDALLYSLPVTVVRVNVEVEKTISRVGPFYRYSQKMLNISDVVTQDKEEWKIKSINIETYGKPDPAKQYAISFSGDNAAPYLNLTPSGVLAGINTDALVLDDYLKEFTNEYVPSLKDVNFNEVGMIEKQMVKTSTAAMAEETANYIYKIRKRRFKILASDYEQLPPDGQSYEVMVRELNALEKEHMELFIGKTESFIFTKSFDIIPDKMSANNDVLFRFSAVNGIVDKMDVSGAPVYIELEAIDSPDLPDNVVISNKNQEVRNGLFYCKPGKVKIKVIDKNVLVKEQELYLGQYGQVVSMPANVLEKADVSIRINPATGALQSVDKK